MKMLKLARFLAVGIVLAFAASAGAATITLPSSSDTYLRDQFSYTVNGVNPVLDNRLQFVPYIQFDMSSLNIDQISSATLRLWKVAGARNDGISNARYATYGLADLPGNTAQNWNETADFDPNDATAGLDFRNVGLEYSLSVPDGVDRSRVVSLDPQDMGVNITETVNNTTGEIVVTGPDLVSFLNARADANGFVTFLIPFEDVNRGYGIASKENASANLHPALDLEYTEVVPEPTAVGLASAAAALLVARRRAT